MTAEKELVYLEDQEIKAYCMKNLQKFIDVMRELADPESELSQKNNTNQLMTKAMASHPAIHVGYYDERRNNVLMVKDSLNNDNLIPKSEAILLNNGKFTVKEGHVLSENDTKYFMKQFFTTGDKSLRDLLNEKYIFSQQLHIFLPANPDNYTLSFNYRSFNSVLHQAYRECCMDNYRPVTGDGFNPLNFIGYLQSTTLHPSSRALSAQSFRDNVQVINKLFYKESVAIGSNSPIFPNLLLIGDYRNDMRDLLEPLNNNVPMYINLNDDRSPLYFPSPREGFAFYDIENCPFGFAVQLQREQRHMTTENRPTPNNTGRIMNYTEKVENFKKTFMMTEHERIRFDGKTAEFNKLLEAYEKKAKELNNKYLNQEISKEELRFKKESLKPQKSPFDNPVFLGVEIEVVPKIKYRNTEGQSQIIKEIADSSFGDHCIMKFDRSIDSSGLGIEIVTVPATLAYHLKKFEELFKSTPTKKSPFTDKCMSTNSCGIHVHISKNCLPPIGWGKLQEFINNPINASFVDKMAGRSPNMYCEKTNFSVLKEKPLSYFTKRVTKGNKLKGELTFEENHDLPHNARRVAVNFMPAHTIEMRLFKSSTDKSNILRKLEFADALVSMIQSTDFGTRPITYFDFVNFILEKGNRKTYKNITRWLAAMDMIGHERKRVKQKNNVMYNKLVTAYKWNLTKIPNTPYYKTAKFTSWWSNHPNNRNANKEGVK